MSLYVISFILVLLILGLIIYFVDDEWAMLVLLFLFAIVTSLNSLMAMKYEYMVKVNESLTVNECQYNNEILYCKEGDKITIYDKLPFSDKNNYYILLSDGLIK